MRGTRDSVLTSHLVAQGSILGVTKFFNFDADVIDRLLSRYKAESNRPELASGKLEMQVVKYAHIGCIHNKSHF